MNYAKLAHMANQISANLAAQGEAAAVAQTAQHIRRFWDPRMRQALLAGAGEGLEPLALAALALLAGDGAG